MALTDPEAESSLDPGIAKELYDKEHPGVDQSAFDALDYLRSPGKPVTDETPNPNAAGGFALGDKLTAGMPFVGQGNDLASQVANQGPGPQPSLSFDKPAELEPQPAGGAPYVADTTGKPGFAAPPVPPTKAQAAAMKQVQREHDLLNDPTAFAANGNVVTGPSEQAKLEGGVANTQAEAYLAGVEANKINAGREQAKQALLLQVADKNYKEYTSEVESIDRNARTAIEGQRKRAAEIASKTIQPHGVFNQKGALGGIMWALGMMAASQTKNSSQNMGMLMDAADAMINRDITAQKDNLGNQWKAFEANQAADKDIYGLDVKGLANLATQQQVRYAMVEKSLDLKIAQMGNPAAERAGLLNVKAAIGDKLAKSQMHFQDQIHESGEKAKDRANAIYLERMKIDGAEALKNLEHKHSQEDKANEAGIVTGEKTGLIATDAKGNQRFEPETDATGKATGRVKVDEAGKPVPLALRARNAADAVKLNETVDGANALHTNLLVIKDELSRMTNKDLVDGNYTPRYRAAVRDAGFAKARQINGARPTDEDVKAGTEIEQGNDPAGNGLVANFGRVLTSKGSTVEGMRRVVDTNLASIGDETTSKLKGYLDRDSLQKNNIVFKPQNLKTEPAINTHSTAETVQDLGGTLAQSKQASNIRKPYDKATVDNLLSVQTAGVPGVVGAYEQDKAAGRLPKLASEKEKNLLDRATTEFEHSTPRRIVLLTKALAEGSNKYVLSDEGRFRLVMEAAAQLKGKQDLVNQIVGQGVYDVVGGNSANPGLPAAKGQVITKSGKEPDEALADFMNSDEWRQAKKRFGLKDIED